MRKNLQNLKRKRRRKLKRSIDEKPPNSLGTAEENRKIADALDLLAPQGALTKSVIFAPSPEGCVEL